MKINAYKLSTALNQPKYDEIYESLSIELVKKGFISAGSNKFFSPDKFKTVQVEALYVNYGFQVRQAYLANKTYFAIVPKRFLTKDGKIYDHDFHLENIDYLYSNSIEYNDFVDIIESVKNLLGVRFTAGDFEFELDDQIPDLELGYTGNEPQVLFGGSQERHTFPAAGLKRFGPWDFNTTSSKVSPEIFIGLLGVDIGKSVLKKVYFGDDSDSNGFKGFEKVYRRKLTGDKSTGSVIITEEEFLACNTAEEVKTLLLTSYKKFKKKPDVLIIRLPNSIANKISNIDLHDWIKVVFWELLQPTQIILQSTMENGTGLTVDNVALGIYVSAGGRPWILDEPFVNQIFVGIGFGRKDDNSKVVGIMEVIDTFGVTLDMQLSQIKASPETEDNHLHLTFDEIKGFIDKAIADYTSRNIVIDRIAIHKTTSFNEEERGIIAYGKDKGVIINLVHIDTRGNGIYLINDKNKYQLPARLSFWSPQDNKAILYTTGRTNFASKSPFIPKPIVVNLENTDGDYTLKQACIDIVKLTKLNWNSVNSFEKDPVSLTYAINMAKLLKLGLRIEDISCEIKYIF